MPDNQHSPLPSTRLRRGMWNRLVPFSWAGGPLRDGRQMASESFAPQCPLGQFHFPSPSPTAPRPSAPGQHPPAPSQLRCLKVLLGMPRSRLEEGRRVGREWRTSACRLGGQRSTSTLVKRSRPRQTQAQVSRPSYARPLICLWRWSRRLQNSCAELFRWTTLDRLGSCSRTRPTAVAVAAEMHQGMNR